MAQVGSVIQLLKQKISGDVFKHAKKCKTGEVGTSLIQSVRSLRSKTRKCIIHTLKHTPGATSRKLYRQDDLYLQFFYVHVRPVFSLFLHEEYFIVV